MNEWECSVSSRENATVSILMYLIYLNIYVNLNLVGYQETVSRKIDRYFF